MSDGTKIEWTDATWTPVKGCTRASEGCRNCYAEIMAARFSKPGQWGEGLAGIVDTPQGRDHRWTGAVRFDETELLKPLRWKKPRRIFVCSTSDLFQDAVPDEWIDRVFAVMALCPQHTFQVLTKRSALMRAYMNDPQTPFRIARAVLDMAIADPSLLSRKAWPVISIGDPDDPSEVTITWPLPNVWAGVSVEDQQRANERIPDLLATPAAVRWISAEPLLGPLDLSRIVLRRDGQLPSKLSQQLGDYIQPLTGNFTDSPTINWVVVGGESGPGARPMHPDWARALRDQCAAAGVPFFFKQWGEWATIFDRDVEDPDWRRCGQWQSSHPRGRWHNLAGGTGFHGDRVVYVDRIGKANAGRRLDGVQHDGYPA